MRAHRMLVDERFAGPIGAIAFDSGFSDLSHFNRTFRRRFGMTPSEGEASVIIEMTRFTSNVVLEAPVRPGSSRPKLPAWSGHRQNKTAQSLFADFQPVVV